MAIAIGTKEDLITRLLNLLLTEEETILAALEREVLIIMKKANEIEEIYIDASSVTVD